MLALINKEEGHEKIQNILDLCREGKIKAYVSNRIFDPDSWKMPESEKIKVKELIKEYNITIEGSCFRWGFSRYSDRDKLSGSATTRSKQEMELFRSIAGQEPASRLTGSNKPSKDFPNKIGDYDALYDHFCSKRDVFLVIDRKKTSSDDKRKKYEGELAFFVKGPKDFEFS